MGEILTNRVGFFPFVACLSCGRLIPMPNPYSSLEHPRHAKFTTSDVCKDVAQMAQKKTAYFQYRHDQPETDNYYGTVACICDRPSCRARIADITRKVGKEYFDGKDRDRGRTLRIHREKVPTFELPKYNHKVKLGD